MNHKDLLIAAAKAIGWNEFEETEYGLWISAIEDYFNPITNKADRWDLCERCGLTIYFDTGVVGLPIRKRSEDSLNAYLFAPNDDESQAIAVLKAAVASKGD